MSRIAFIDLNFHWPPTGGSVVDLKEVACRARIAGHQVKLFVPRFDKYFPRGVLRQSLPIEVETLEFGRDTFNRETLPRRFKERVRAYDPDLVFVGDGYYLKPILINALGGDFRILLRIYSHEVLCFRNSMYLLFDFKKGVWNPFHKGPCDNHLLKNPKECYHCFIHGWKLHMIKAIVASGYCHRLLHYPHEYLAAKAYREEYVEEVRKSFRYIADIVAYNDFMANLLSSFHHNIHVIPSGVDVDHFDAPVPENSSSTKLILMPGRVNDRLKGFKVMLAAAKLLRGRRQDFKVLATLPEGAKGLPEYVENVGWWTQEALPRLYEKADIVVAPVVWQEPFGIIPLEAMSCRRPIVASRAGGHLVTIRDGETGLLFDPGNALDLAEKLSMLLDSRTLRIQMGRNGRERVASEFSWDRIMEKYYQGLL